MPEGVQYPDIIDQVAHQAKDDTIIFTMFERRPWDGSETRILELRHKINTYVAFVVQGQFAKLYPDLQGKPVVIRLLCHQEPPDEKTMTFLNEMNARLSRYGLCLRVVVIKVGE